MKLEKVAPFGRSLGEYKKRKGKAEGRYVVGEIPKVSFHADQFDIAICSYLLFLYLDQFTYELHLESILETLRVASEAYSPISSVPSRCCRHPSRRG
jgi:hypothetical protein